MMNSYRASAAFQKLDRRNKINFRNEPKLIFGFDTAMD